MIKAEVVADSSMSEGHRLTTLLLTFPRYILAELNTHRVLSKNSASSRAIPAWKMIESVQKNPFIPIAWQKEHTGMQGFEYFESDEDIKRLNALWLYDAMSACSHSNIISEAKVTKQLTNRYLEPFMYHTVLISGTEWENFFQLRCPEYIHGERIFRSRKDWLNYNFHGANDNHTKQYLVPVSEIDWLKINKGMADIHMMALAEAIWDAMNESEPEKLRAGKWHLPFINIEEFLLKDDPKLIDVPLALKVSTARAARTSYTIVGEEKEFTIEQQVALHDRMANQTPFHASPFEHCARAMSVKETLGYVHSTVDFDDPEKIGDFETGWCRNYRGFIQYRHILEQERKIN